MKFKKIIIGTFVVVIISLLFLSVNQRFFAPPLNNQEVTLLNSYEDKIIIAEINSPFIFNYSWYINNQLIKSGKTHTSFLTHFDNDLITSEEEYPQIEEDISFGPSIFGEGLRGITYYQTPNNLNLSEGTIEFWLTLLDPLTSDVFNRSASPPGDPYFFRHVYSISSEVINQDASIDELYLTNLDPYEFYTVPLAENVISYLRFAINLDTQKSIGFTAYNGDWPSASQLSQDIEEVPIGKPIYFAITYSSSKNESTLFMDGFKIANGKYPSNFETNPIFRIGNPNAIVDEFRIGNEILSNEEVRENYMKGIPFSNNDILFNENKKIGDEIKLRINNGSTEVIKENFVLPPMINITSPSGYIIPNTNEIDVEFKTDLGIDCFYGENPADSNKLTKLTSSNGENYYIKIPVMNNLNYVPLYIKCGDYSVYKRFKVLPKVDNNLPKIANLWWGNSIDGNNETEIEYLARYDILSVSKGNQVNPLNINKIRQKNKDIIITTYVTAIGYQDFSTYPFSDLIKKIEPNMKLQDNEGNTVANPSFPNNKLGNLYTGNNFSEVLSNHIENDMIAEGIWDGIWFDNAGANFWFLVDYNLPDTPYVLSPDIDMDGINENLSNSIDLIKSKTLWKEGMNKLMKLTREKAGNNIILVGNGADYYPENYNGKLWEGSLEHWQGGSDFGPTSTFLRYSNSTYFTRSFPYWQEKTQEPHQNWNLFTNELTVGTAAHYQRNRLGLTASIIGEIYYTVEYSFSEGRDYSWYDEYWVDLITGGSTNSRENRGYLGESISEIIEIEDNLWKREFENGVVLLNSRTVPATINLTETYRYIQGTQDPIANPGGFTSSNILLNGKDGRILLRALCKNNPSNDPECINYCGDGLCGSNENCKVCSTDCGACPTNINEPEEEVPTNIPERYCGDNICSPSEDCNSCVEDCDCEGEIQINLINLDENPSSQIITKGGQYTIIMEGISNIISITSITPESVKIIANGVTTEILFETSQEIVFSNIAVRISYLDYSTDGVKLGFNKVEIQNPVPYGTREQRYFIILVFTYMALAILFLINYKKHKDKSF